MGVDAQASLGRVGPVRAAWGRGKVAWGGVGLSRVEYHGTDAEARLTSGRRPSGVGGYETPTAHSQVKSGRSVYHPGTRITSTHMLNAYLQDVDRVILNASRSLCNLSLL